MTPFRAELVRKSIHMSSLWMPLVIYFLPQQSSIILFAALSLGALGIEEIRRRTPHINAFFKNILREHEHGQSHKHVGATWTLIGALFASLFSDPIAITAMAVQAICDTAASLVGMRFGRNKIFGKSFEGSFAFFISGLIVIAILNPLFDMPAYIWISAIALVFTTIGELFSGRLKLDDNVFIPALMCLAMWALAALV